MVGYGMKNLISVILSIFMSVSYGTYMPKEPVIEEATEVFDDAYDEYQYVEDGKVICAVDAINASCGFLVPPLKVEYDEDKSCAEIFVDILSEYGYSPIYSGTLESDFYLSAIGGIDTSAAAVPEEMSAFLSTNKIAVSDTLAEEGTLSEFDLTASSGWVYTVNGEMPNVSMCDYYPAENDVIRLRYSLCFGADTGFHPEWGFIYDELDIPDIDDAIRAAAEYGAENCADAIEKMSEFGARPEDIYPLLPVN